MMKKIWTKIISVVLVIAMTITIFPSSVFAEEASVEEDIYIKSVQLAQASSREEAKSTLEKEGYTFLEGNLNEGTGADGIWLGYTTTANPSEAIYDLKVMNMKGGFTLTSMKEALEAQEDTFAQMAMDLRYLIDEFVEAYEVNSVPAQKAYKALNFFRMVENESEFAEENGLGYQIVNGQLSDTALTEMLMLCDSGLVDSVIKILTMGIQMRNENWMEQLSKIGPYNDEMEYSTNEDELKRRAEQLLPVLELYSQTYNAMDLSGLIPDKLNDNFEPENNGNEQPENLPADKANLKKMDESRYKIYKVVFDELAKYQYGANGYTLKDFFCSLESEGSAKKLYPLVSVLSDGEFAALSYGCFLEVGTGASATYETFEGYDELYATITEDADSVYMYAGVDKVLLQEDSVVAFTEVANRHMASTGELEFYEKENMAENAWETGKHVAMALGAAGMAIMGVAKLTVGITMIVGFASTTAAASISSGVLAGLVKFCSIVGGPYALLITIAIVARVALYSFIISVIMEEINGKIDWDENPIPEYLYDVKEVGFYQSSSNNGILTEHIKRPVFVLYEAVKDKNGDVVDLNARSKDSSQWLTMYVSYDRQGDNAKPIKAKDLLVKTGNGQTPEGYVPLTRFGEVVAYNLNQWDDDDDVNGVYFFYKQDQSVSVDDGKTYYIYDVYLQTGESDTHCINLLQSAGYTPINVNLTPDLTDDDIVFQDHIYTYLGYKVTTNPNNAIRDIRIEYGPSQGEYKFGGATYAESGSNGVVTLYATKYRSAGTPLLAGGLKCVNNREDAPYGHEPVNFFAGGPAVNFNVTSNGVKWDTKEFYIYFLPETTFTDGEAYLGGIAYLTFQTSALTGPMKLDEVSREVVAYIKAKTGKMYPTTTDLNKIVAMYNYLCLRNGYSSFESISTSGSLIDSVAYFKTYNPYRAIYGIKATNIEGRQNQYNFEKQGYVEWNLQRWSTNSSGIGSGNIIPINSCTLTYNKIGADSSNIGGTLYVSGNTSNDNIYTENGQMSKTQPLKMSDILCVKEGNYKSVADSFKPLTDVFKNSQDNVVLKNTEYKNGSYSTQFKFYITGNEDDRPYVSNVLAIDELTLHRGYSESDANISRDDINDSMMLAQLVNQGATNFCDYKATILQRGSNSNIEMNAIKFGYTRTATSSSALRDIFIYFNKFSADEPPKQLYRGNITYVLLGEISYNLTGHEGAPKPGIYLYGTYDSRAGSKIVDFEVSASPFMEGYETLRTKDGRSLWSEISDYVNEQKQENPMDSAKDVYEELINFFKFQTYVYRENDNFYLHIKREDNNARIQKPYIGELYLASSSLIKELAIEELFDKGAEGYVEMDLNEGAGGDFVFVGYKYTENPQNAIKEIRAYHKKNPPQTLMDDNGYTFTLVDNVDLNKDAGGDYIYLYTTKETDSWPIMNLKATYDANNTAGRQTWVDGSDVTHITYSTRMWDSKYSSDLNDGAGGKYIYLQYTTVDSSFVGTYQDVAYGEDITYSRDAYIDQKETGKYIGGLYVMDKNTLRQEKLAQNIASEDCTCDKISDQEVFDRLKQMGATTIITTPIQVGGEEYFNNNKNKVFIGYSRTNNSRQAIRNIALKAEIFSLGEPRESIEIDRKTYNIVAPAASEVKELPKAINLIGLEDGQDQLLPRLYLYYTKSGSDYLYDICIDNNPIKNGWISAKSANGVDPFADIYNLASKEYKLCDKDIKNLMVYEMLYTVPLRDWMDDMKALFDPEDANATPFYIHYKNYEGSDYEKKYPYIGEVFVAKGESKREALSNLVAHGVEGFVDVDLNQKAGGDFVYMGYKRVAKTKDALRDLVVIEGKNPELTKRLEINGNSIKYTLVSNVDLNSDAGGDYLYLYGTDVNDVGNPIIGLSVEENIISSLKCGIERCTVRLADKNAYTDEYIDLNENAGGSYIYMIMTRETTAGHKKGADVEIEYEEPTCGEEGYRLEMYNCVDCGKYVEEEQIFPATGKHFDEEGDGDHECDECGEEEITKHIAGNVKEKNRVEPTCIALGSHRLIEYCAECGEVLRDTTAPIEINPENHEDGDDKDHNCDLCGAVDIEDHTPANPKEENRIEPTEESEGSYTEVIYCEECGEKLSEKTVVLPVLNKDESDDESLIASLFGNGSPLAIGGFIGFAGLAAILIYLQKKKKEGDTDYD